MGVITTLRQFHIADMAVFDWVATAATAYLIARATGKSVGMVFVVLILIAVLVHVILGIPTRFNAYLGLAKKEDVYAARAKADDHPSA